MISNLNETYKCIKKSKPSNSLSFENNYLLLRISLQTVILLLFPLATVHNLTVTMHYEFPQEIYSILSLHTCIFYYKSYAIQCSLTKDNECKLQPFYYKFSEFSCKNTNLFKVCTKIYKPCKSENVLDLKHLTI